MTGLLFTVNRTVNCLIWLVISNSNSSTSYCLRSSSCRTDLSIHFQPSWPTTIWMFFLVTLTLSLVHSTMRQTTESVKWRSVVDTAVWDFLVFFRQGRPLHTGFELWSLAWLAWSTGKSATTYTTVAVTSVGLLTACQ